MFGHHGWWMQPTSKLEYESGLARYMGQWDTRVAGPWSDVSPPTMKTSDAQLLEQQGLLPWHQQMLERPHVSTAQCIIVFMKLISRSNRFNSAMHRWRFAPNDKRIRGRAVSDKKSWQSQRIEGFFFGCRVQNLALNWDQKLNQKSPAGVCESKKWWFDVSHSATILQWVRFQPNTANNIVPMHSAGKSQVHACAPSTYVMVCTSRA